MTPLYTSAQVRAAEAELMRVVPEGTLMERAATGLAAACARAMGAVVGSKVVLLAGPGNNGGDVLYAGATLRGRGAQVLALTADGRCHEGGATALLEAGGSIESWRGDAEAVEDADVIIDGLLGIGARGAPRGAIAELLDAASLASALKIAADIPTGVDADTGEVAGAVFDADLTVTFGCAKPGLFVSPGLDSAGEVLLVDIGLSLGPSPIELSSVRDAGSWLPLPRTADHKYRRGVVGIAAGSAQYPGAAILTAGGARGIGPGMVRALQRGDGVADLVVERFPDVVPDASDPATQRVDAWACGPGLGSDDAAAITAVLGCAVPVVLDAGALSAVAASRGLRDAVQARVGQLTVMTPHDGEFARLWPHLVGPRLESTLLAARETGAVVVRKGPGTIIAGPDGRAVVDCEGTAALSTAGSGDVLCGAIAAVLAAAAARETPVANAVEAVAAAVAVHGVAGQLAAAGGRPVTALDVLNCMPDAVAQARRGGTGH